MDDSSGTARECKRASVADISPSSSSASCKRRRVGSPVGGEAELEYSGPELAGCALLCGFTEELEVEFRPPEASFLCSGKLSWSGFSSGVPAFSTPLSTFGSCKVVEDRLVAGDHQEKNFEAEISTCIDGNSSIEATPSAELCQVEKDHEKMELQQSPEDNRRSEEPEAGGKVTMPSQAEIEEFFSTAEKYEQKRFTEKYNYDVVKDVPLQGRYQWARLNP